MRFAIFPVHLSKLLRLPRKSEARSYEVLHASPKIILANLKISCSKMQPLSGNLRPDLLTSLMKVSLALRLPRIMPLCRSSSNVPRLPSFLDVLQKHFEKVHNPFAPDTRKHIWTSKSGTNMWCFVVLCTFWLRNVLRATTACTFSTSQLPKVLRSWCAFYILIHFDLEMCFAPQRRALFRRLTTSKSDPNPWCVLYILTSKCASRHIGVHFFDISTSKVVRSWCVLYILTSKCASRHKTSCNCSSLIWPAGSAPAALASLLIDTPEPQIIGKTQCFATLLPFRAPGPSFFWLFLFSDLLSSAFLFSLTLPFSAFYLSILSEVWLLNFLR